MRGWNAALLVVGVATASSGEARGPQRWTASWGSAQMIADGDDTLTPSAKRGMTLRQIVHLSAGGASVRVRLSNVFGTEPLTIGGASIARAIAPGNARLAAPAMSLRFAGKTSVVIPPGAELFSDPLTLAVTPGEDAAISVYLPRLPSPQTGHPGARATSFAVVGDHVRDRSLTDPTSLTRWYVIADVDVATGSDAATIVAVGDSITDGYGVAIDSNRRWTDVLAKRLRDQTATRAIGVVNAGIGGNRVLRDGLGPNLLSRFDRDVLGRSGVRWTILLEGVNDLGVLTREAPATPAEHAAIVAHITDAYRQMVAKAHARGIKVIGGTIMPLVGNDYYHAGTATEADRQAINGFIRTAGLFDAVIDFDELMRDPQHPDRLAPPYDSGDHLHPSEAGYRRMGEAVPLDLFATPSAATDDGPAIALTFDDIPAHGPLPPGVTRADVIRDIATTLTAANAPAFGFYTAGFGLDDPTSAAAVKQWRAGGFPLGNHSYSHRNLAEIGATAFTADIVRDEAPLAAAAGPGADWHWFRYPFLSEGAGADRDAVRASLRQRGYRIAAVTMGFNDFNWNGPYPACAAKGNVPAVAQLERGYLADARAAALAARAAAKQQVGHDIPYVLLMHVGAFDAHMLPALLDLYKRMGFRFVTLPQAEADPFYADAVDLTRPGPSDSLPGATLTGPPADLCK